MRNEIVVRELSNFLDILQDNCNEYFPGIVQIYVEHPANTNLDISIFIDSTASLTLKFGWRDTLIDDEIHTEFVSYWFNAYEISMLRKEIHPTFFTEVIDMLDKINLFINELLKSILAGEKVILTETIIY